MELYCRHSLGFVLLFERRGGTYYGSYRLWQLFRCLQKSTIKNALVELRPVHCALCSKLSVALQCGIVAVSQGVSSSIVERFWRAVVDDSPRASFVVDGWKAPPSGSLNVNFDTMLQVIWSW